MINPAPTLVRLSTTDSDITHLYCCNPDVALCGTDVSDVPELADDAEITCVVCADLEEQPCPTCGY